MQIKPELTKEYEDYKKVNSEDSYSNAVVTFGERWAKLMEDEIANGKKVSDIAQSTSNEADIEGISGFMYGCAVSALTHFWVHGEALRKWHNKEYDYAGDGVVDPAVLTIG